MNNQNAPPMARHTTTAAPIDPPMIALIDKDDFADGEVRTGVVTLAPEVEVGKARTEGIVDVVLGLNVDKDPAVLVAIHDPPAQRGQHAKFVTAAVPVVLWYTVPAMQKVCEDVPEHSDVQLPSGPTRSEVLRHATPMAHSTSLTSGQQAA